MLKPTKSLLTLIPLLIVALAACGGAPATVGLSTPEPTIAGQASPTPMVIDTFNPVAAGNRTVVKWFVGLGTGGNPPQIDAEKAVVEAFNKSQGKTYLALQIVDNTVAYTTLATQIAGGNVPDIIGPVGTAGRNGFSGQFLDLSQLIQKNNVDLGVYDPAVVGSYNLPGQGQIGLPFAVYPSFIYFNKDLFDEASLPYPPQTFGAQYEGKDWDMDTFKELAKKLTVDNQGNDATSVDFNPQKIEQFGFETQWGTDPRAEAAIFGAGSFVAKDGKAQIPQSWLTAWKWYYDAMWTEHFMPTEAYRNSDLLGKGNTFNSGHVAMAHTHLWYTCCIDPPSKNGAVKNWDIAVVPAVNGKTTAKLHGDTFVIMKATKHPDQAFEAYRYLIQSKQLLEVYGAMPAIKSFQPAFFKSLDEKFAPNKVHWQVAVDSLSHPDNPNHEEDLPNFLKAKQAITDFGTLMRSKPGLDIDAESQKFLLMLNRIFAEKP